MLYASLTIVAEHKNGLFNEKVYLISIWLTVIKLLASVSSRGQMEWMKGMNDSSKSKIYS